MTEALPPTIIIGTPRSRTAWLAAALSTDDVLFAHEPAPDWKGVEDLDAFLDGPAPWCCDSGLTVWAHHILERRPATRLFAVTRSPEDVYRSFMRLSPRVFGNCYPGISLLHREAAELVSASLAMPICFDRLADVAYAERVFGMVHGRRPRPGWARFWVPLRVETDWCATIQRVYRNRRGFPGLTAERLAEMA